MFACCMLRTHAERGTHNSRCSPPGTSQHRGHESVPSQGYAIQSHPRLFIPRAHLQWVSHNQSKEPDCPILLGRFYSIVIKHLLNSYAQHARPLHESGRLAVTVRHAQLWHVGCYLSPFNVKGNSSRPYYGIQRRGTQGGCHRQVVRQAKQQGLLSKIGHWKWFYNTG
jgi:hypothetical protein